MRQFGSASPQVGLPRGFGAGTLMIAAEIVAGVLAVLGVRLLPAGQLMPLLLIAAIGGILCVPLATRAAQRRFELFEPTVVFAVAFGAMFVVRPLAIVVTGDYTYTRPSRAIDFAGTFEHTLVLAALGAAAFVVGYALPWGRMVALRAPRVPQELHPGTALAGAAGVALAAILLFGLFVATSGGLSVLRSFLSGRSPEQTSLFRASTAYLASAPYMLIPAAVLLLNLARTQRDLFVRGLGLFVLGLVLLRAIPMGSRMMLLPLFGAMFVNYYLSRGRRPSFLAVVLLGVILLLGSTVLLNLRTAAARQDQGIPSIVSRTLAEPFASLDPIFFRADAEMVETLAVAVQEIPQTFAHTHGQTVLGDMVLRPVPRVIWSGKPLPPRERLIRSLWPDEYAAGVANPEFSALLYYYWDFGAIGVVVGFTAFGLLSRGLFEFYLRDASAPMARLLYALVLPLLVIGLRDSPTDTVMRGAFVVGPLLAVIVVAKRRPASAERATGLDAVSVR